MTAHIRLLHRRKAVAACAVALVALSASHASAQAYGRMDPEQRERLRSELRQHDAQRAERARGDEARRRMPQQSEGRRLSRDERERLREQVREQVREARSDASRRGAGRR